MGSDCSGVTSSKNAIPSRLRLSARPVGRSSVVHDYGISHVFSLLGRDDDNKHAEKPSNDEISAAIENGFSYMVEKGREIGEWIQSEK